MSYLEKYYKYKSKYLKIKNQSGGGKHYGILLGNIRGDLLEYIPELNKQLKKLNCQVYQYQFKFYYQKFTLADTTFENVADDLKLFIDKNKLKNNLIICLEESAPFGLFFVDKYPKISQAIICYPLRLNTKESLEQSQYHKLF